ncbi:MAG: hypothetical protein RIS76_2040 [Verrucomicrobiota bacterium]|jgi:hypothetical protein
MKTDNVSGLFRATAWTRAGLYPRLRFVAPYWIAAGLLATGFGRLRPVLRESADLAGHLGNLVGRVEMSEQVLREAEREEVDSLVEQLKEPLWGGETEILDWLGDAESMARDLGWSLGHEVGEAERRSGEGVDLLEIPVRMVMRAATGGSRSGVSRRAILRMGEWIARSERRADLLEMTVSVPKGGILEAAFTVHLWVATPLP